MAEEIIKVKELGERIGYGHLMSLASALWRRKLREENNPTLGAFVPTILPLMLKKGRIIAISEAEMYDMIIEKE